KRKILVVHSFNTCLRHLVITSVPAGTSRFLNISSVFHVGNGFPFPSFRVRHLSLCKARNTDQGSLCVTMNAMEARSDQLKDDSATCSRKSCSMITFRT